MTLPEKIEMVRKSVRAVTRGYKVSRLITGIPGIGKSKAVLDELVQEETNFEHISGGIKDARSFYMTLSDKNDEDLILFFDDTNDIFSRKDSREILRVAVLNEPSRKLFYTDSVLEKMKYKYPTPIEFKSKIIIVTNIQKKKIDPAIVSRTSAIEIISTIPEVFEYIGENLEQAPPQKISLEWKKEVYNYIKEEVGVKKVKQIDFRIFEDACVWRAASEKCEDWKKHIYEIIT